MHIYSRWLCPLCVLRENGLKMEAAKQLICILGMHRSGTSCVTGSLQQGGLNLGDCHTWNPHNKKGNRENQVFVDLNDSVLASNGGAWDLPPKKSRWNAEQLERAKKLLENNFGESPLGFKDPRTLLVVSGWKKVYPEIQFVGVFRHPNAVAQSLQKRSDMPQEKAFSLWFAYNQALLREHKKSAFPILCFDDDEAVFHTKLSRVANDLGLTRESDDKRFYDERLRTSNSNANQPGKPLPWKLKRLYSRLLKRSV